MWSFQGADFTQHSQQIDAQQPRLYQPAVPCKISWDAPTINLLDTISDGGVVHFQINKSKSTYKRTQTESSPLQFLQTIKRAVHKITDSADDVLALPPHSQSNRRQYRRKSEHSIPSTNKSKRSHKELGPEPTN